MARMNYSGNVVDSPPWLADKFNDYTESKFPAKLNVAGLVNQFGISVTVTANTAAAATSIPVTALAPLLNSPTPLIALGRVLIPIGTTLYFGGAKYATLSADAKQGDTAISVVATPTAVVAGDNTKWQWSGRIYIQSGMPLGRTLAERDAGTGFDLLIPGTDDEKGLLMFDLDNAQFENDIELLAPNKAITIYENWLPGYSTSLRPSGTDSATMTLLRSLYTCIVGIP